MVQKNRLQYISQGQDAKTQVFGIQKALDAGITWIQLRYKNRPDPNFMKLAEDVKRFTELYNAVYIINDFPEVVNEVDADGVHLGIKDASVKLVRKMIKPDKIIGGTVNSREHLQQRIDEKCDYAGVGPFRFTKTKTNLSPILGIEGYKKLNCYMQKSGLYIPIYAIGGIQEKDISNLRKEKIHGIAVSSMIATASKPRTKVKKLNKILYGKI